MIRPSRASPLARSLSALISLCEKLHILKKKKKKTKERAAPSYCIFLYHTVHITSITQLQYAEAEKIALRGTPEAAHAAGLGPVKAEEGAAAGLKDLALVDVERRLRIRVVVLAHRVWGGEMARLCVETRDREICVLNRSHHRT